MKNGLITDADGTKRYYLNGKLHRVGKPAEIYTNGIKFWYVHGQRHRVTGPAIEWGAFDRIWFLYDKELVQPEEFKTMEEFIEKMNEDEEYSLQHINKIQHLILLIKNPTDKQKRLHAMKWKI